MVSVPRPSYPYPSSSLILPLIFLVFLTLHLLHLVLNWKREPATVPRWVRGLLRVRWDLAVGLLGASWRQF